MKETAERTEKAMVPESDDTPGRYTADWFSPNIPTFARILRPFAGRPVRALEIGVYEGRSAAWLLANILTHRQARLYCLDIIRQPILKANIAAAGGAAKTRVLIASSRKIIPWLRNDSFDFAYVDGSHSTHDVLEDAVLVFRKVKVGGLIGFDDYLWDDPAFNRLGAPKPAIDAFLTCYSHKLEVLEHGSQVWVRKTAN